MGTTYSLDCFLRKATMAQRTITVLTDDIEGGEASATQTVTFGLDGVSYVIDLNDANAARLREQLSRWTSSARAGSRAKARRSGVGGGRAVSATPGQNATVREWARDNGHQVSARGRISVAVQEAYNQAHR